MPPPKNAAAGAIWHFSSGSKSPLCTLTQGPPGGGGAGTVGADANHPPRRWRRNNNSHGQDQQKLVYLVAVAPVLVADCVLPRRASLLFAIYGHGVCCRFWVWLLRPPPPPGVPHHHHIFQPPLFSSSTPSVGGWSQIWSISSFSRRISSHSKYGC